MSKFKNFIKSPTSNLDEGLKIIVSPVINIVDKIEVAVCIVSLESILITAGLSSLVFKTIKRSSSNTSIPACSQRFMYKLTFFLEKDKGFGMIAFPKLNSKGPAA